VNEKRIRRMMRLITFYNCHRLHTVHGGQPPVVVYFNQIETGQQVQAVAKISQKFVQGLGSSSQDKETTFQISTHDEKIAVLCRRRIAVGDGLVAG